jgi:hypothetical protein
LRSLWTTGSRWQSIADVVDHQRHEYAQQQRFVGLGARSPWVAHLG